MLPGLCSDMSDCLLFWPGIPVGPVAGQGIPHIDHGEDARRKRDLIAFEPARVARAEDNILAKLEWIAVSLEISRGSKADDDEDESGLASPRLDWVASGAAGGFLLGVVNQQFLAALISIVLVAIDTNG